VEAVPGGLQSRPHGIKRSCEKRALLRRALIPMLPSGDADVVVIALANLFATVFEARRRAPPVRRAGRLAMIGRHTRLPGLPSPPVGFGL
jgi:hypothetical protein